jgi:uncharacterized protein DUF3995
MHPAMLRQFTAGHIREPATQASDARRAGKRECRHRPPCPDALAPGRSAARKNQAAAGTGWRRGPLFAYLAALVALAAIPVHLYWALGGTWGLPGGAATADLPGIHATNLAVSVLLACGALFLLGLTRPWSRRLPAMLMRAPVWAGAVVCISHALFGIAAKGLYVAGVHAAVSWPEHELTAAQKNLAALRDLAIFEPWFLVLGLLLALAGHGFAPTATRGRLWTLSMLAAIVLICAFGFVLAVTHHTFAVS